MSSGDKLFEECVDREIKASGRTFFGAGVVFALARALDQWRVWVGRRLGALERLPYGHHKEKVKLTNLNDIKAESDRYNRLYDNLFGRQKSKEDYCNEFVAEFYRKLYERMEKRIASIEDRLDPTKMHYTHRMTYGKSTQGAMVRLRDAERELARMVDRWFPLRDHPSGKRYGMDAIMACLLEYRDAKRKVEES